nr:phage GP46 family protein [Enterovibrio nigricans]
MSVSIVFDMMKNTGVIIEGERVENDTVSALVLISLFTDARAQESDTLPDNSRNLRGWPGDSFYDAHGVQSFGFYIVKS